ncbi:HVA22-like protein k [Pyrus x bretschneideri]|uniref:HVA22-like protein k n=1 Tax=Pyrus x bretschneideri TaxID=225117 RepID=UPI00203039F3|nr:HVA22-like protein k [Pyrus x bretschneideri]
MLLYWAAYGSFSVAEVFSDKILSWFPLYYHMKFAFLVWLQLPASNGARHLYMNHLRPFFQRHQVRLDQAVDFIYGQMTKFISSHQGELQFAKALFMKVVASVRGIVPGQRQSNRAIEGPAKESQDTESDIDE